MYVHVVFSYDVCKCSNCVFGMFKAWQQKKKTSEFDSQARQKKHRQAHAIVD